MAEVELVVNCCEEGESLIDPKRDGNRGRPSPLDVSMWLSFGLTATLCVKSQRTSFCTGTDIAARRAVTVTFLALVRRRIRS